MELSSEKSILETFVCHRELDSVLVLQDSTDELGGDINECDFFNAIKWNVSISRKPVEHSELVFSKWPCHEIMCGPIQIKDRPVGFNLTGYGKLCWYCFIFHVATNP